MNYRIYGNHKLKGWILIEMVYHEELAYDCIRQIDQEQYYTILIVKHDIELNMDACIYDSNLDRGFSRRR